MIATLLKRLSLGLAIVIAVLMSGASVQAAGSATLTLSAPASASTGSTVSVTIVETGQNINVVTADLTYDQNQLQYLNIDDSSSGFKSAVHGSGGNGKVDVTRYATDDSGNPTTLSGRQVIAIVNFKVLATSGTVTVSTAASSLIVSDGVNEWDGVLSTASITVGGSAPAVVPIATATPSPATKPKSTQTATPTAPTPAPTGPSVTFSPSTTSASAGTTRTIAKPVTLARINANKTGYRDTIAGVGLLLLALAASIFLIWRWQRSHGRLHSVSKK